MFAGGVPELVLMCRATNDKLLGQTVPRFFLDSFGFSQLPFQSTAQPTKPTQKSPLLLTQPYNECYLPGELAGMGLAGDLDGVNSGVLSSPEEAGPQRSCEADHQASVVHSLNAVQVQQAPVLATLPVSGDPANVLSVIASVYEDTSHVFS